MKPLVARHRARTAEAVAALAPNSFRLDIQGMRAIAVGAVVLYHAGLPWLPGGYVGVDIFFVISGFLITSHLLRSLEKHGRINFAEFYARRVRRILPASFVVLAATLVIAATTLSPIRAREAAADAIATVLYVPNVLFAYRGTQYLNETDPPSLFQHYWSLGVEEQFYLVWPLALLAFFWARRSHRVMAALMAAVVVLSFTACVSLTVRAQPWAFFTLPTRAWELATGGLVAAFLCRGKVLPRVAAVPVGWLGLGAVIASIVVMDGATPFPGPWAAVPVAGTAAVILAGATAGPAGPALALSRKPMVWVGEISYSLYLVHWPMMTLPAAILGRTDPVPVRWQLLVAMACVPLAWLSYRNVETPFRAAQRLRAAPPWRVGVATLAVTAVVVAAAGMARWHAERAPMATARVIEATEIQSAPPNSTVVPANLRPPLAEAPDDIPVIYHNGCQLDISGQEPRTDCLFGTEPTAPRVVLFGDSHATQIMPALSPLADAGAIYLETMTKSGCPAADFEVLSGAGKPHTTCVPWRRLALERLQADPPALVVISDYAGESNAVDGARFTAEEWTEALGRTLDQLPAETRVLVVGDTPTAGTTPSACLAEHLDDASACDLGVGARNGVVQEAQREAAEAAGARFVTLDDYLCGPESCPVIIGDTLVYRDGTHLTATMAANLSPVLAPEVLSLLGQ